MSDASETVAFLAARRAVGPAWSLVALMGTDPRGGSALLARHEGTGELRVVSVEPDPTAADGLTVEVTAELHDGLPGPRSVCTGCGTSHEGWPVRCSCGIDLANAESEVAEDEGAARIAAWLRAEGENRYDVLGGLRHSGRRGPAYFARRRDDGRVVALGVFSGQDTETGERRLTVFASEAMSPLDPAERRSPHSGPVRFTPAEAFPVVSDADEQRENERKARLEASVFGSGLLAKIPTPRTDEQVAVPRVCPQCGAEYETGSRFCPNDGSPLRPKVSADPLIGRVIAERYQVLRRLGEGGMGRVYLAEHVKMNRQCALKIMNTQVVHDDDSVQRFAREASNAARIIHPNVAAVFDYGESDGIVYLVMEYVDGEPLSRLIEREGVVAPHRALDIARQVADGLVAAHELGIVHRDLKPDNILVCRARSGREVAKVVDFGIAKAMSEAREDRLTQTGLVIGTPEYMSPEQLVGDPVDARSDIYSLGCILYQMLTGQLPFDAPTREHIIKRRLAEPPPHPRALLAGLPEQLDRVVRTMLARSPVDRYPSALDVRAALDPATALGRDWDPSIHLTPRSAPTLMMAARTTEKLESEAAVARRQRIRRTTGALAMLAVVGTATGYVLTRERGAAPPAAPPSVAADSVAAGRARPVGPPAVAAQTAAVTGRKAALPTVRKPAVTPEEVDTPAPRRADPPPAVTAEVKALRAPIEAYARSWESRDTARVHDAYPALSKDAAQMMQNIFFRPAENVRATVAYEEPTRDGDTATYPFTLQLRITYRETKQTSNSPLRYEAVLVRTGKRWLLTKLSDR